MFKNCSRIKSDNITYIFIKKTTDDTDKASMMLL